MCGIAGFTGKSDGESMLRRMVGTLVHRGPDSDGYYRSDDIQLGMRRLSIIDVETGGQPAFNEDKSLVVIFNGEIYNHIELRDELESQGHEFRSDHSDTEVIAHLYEQYGLDFPHKLNGMFAIALWDKNRNRLVLVRDRVGIKPLYVAEVQGELIFGSEPKAVLAHSQVPRDPNFASLHHYFTFKNVPAPASAFAAIDQLRPGEILVRERGVSHRRRWWRIPITDNKDFDEDAAVPEIRALLEDAVRLRMRSDVPFGAYLSGGLDSSSVVALMSVLSDQPIRTFTLAYEDSIHGKNEDRAFANQVAERYHTDHHEQIVRFDDIPLHIDNILNAFDEPYSGVVSTYFITELIGKHVKVALSGDGADELFASYRPHRLAPPLAAWRRMRDGASNLTPQEEEALAEFRDSPKILDALIDRGDEAAARMEQYLLDDAGKHNIYSSKMRSIVAGLQTETLVRDLYDQSPCRDPLNRALFIDFETLLPDQVLAFVDRLSMAHSVEVRPPFLDYRLVEFAAAIPGSSKIRNGRVKHILKRAVADLLPADLVDRPKEGFLMPIRDWLGGALQEYVKETLSPDRLAIHGLLDSGAVGRMIDAHAGGDHRNGDRLWNLMMFQKWWEKHIA